MYYFEAWVCLVWEKRLGSSHGHDIREFETFYASALFGLNFIFVNVDLIHKCCLKILIPLVHFFFPVAKVLLVVMAKVNFAAIGIYHPAAKVMRFCNIVLPRSKKYQYVLLPRQCSVYPEACGNKSSFHFLSLILLLMYHEIIDPNYEFMCLHQTGGLQA